MRLLVVGAAGQVGGAVGAAAHAAGYEVCGTYATAPPIGFPGPTERLDKGDRPSVASLLDRVRPGVVVDTAALHHVDFCEQHPLDADRVNAAGTEAVATAAARVGARTLFVSTDYVFDGAGRPPYGEEDPPNPLGAYGRSKLAGEAATLAADPRNLVVRSSVIYSWVPMAARRATVSGKGLNFAAWALGELAAGRPLAIVEDQHSSPTLAEDLAGAIVALVGSNGSGRFHAAGATPLSRYEFVLRLAQRFDLDPSRIRPIRTPELRQAARRPLDSRLDSTRLERTTGYRMLAVGPALDRLWRAWSADPDRPQVGAGTRAAT